MGRLLPTTLLLSVLLIPSNGSSVKIASGWTCPLWAEGDTWSSITDIDSCEGLCSNDGGNCTAFTFMSNGNCISYEACPVLERRLQPGILNNETETFLVRLSPTVDQSTLQTFKGGTEDQTLLSHTESQQRYSWTLAVSVRPASSNRRQIIISTEGVTPTGYSLQISNGHWLLNVGNGTELTSIKGTKVHLYKWVRVLASYSHILEEVYFEIDGILIGHQSDVSFQSSHSGVSLGYGMQPAAFIGSIKDLLIYSSFMDSQVLAAINSPTDTTCPMATTLNLAYTVKTEYIFDDYGAAYNGKCLYLGPGEETCPMICQELIGGDCDEGMIEFGKSSEACEDVQQRLGLNIASKRQSYNSDGCLWNAAGHQLTYSTDSGCDTNPTMGGGNGTRLRVCACTPPFETLTLTEQSCGPYGHVCTPCPEILFTSRKWNIISEDYACGTNTNGTGGLITTTDASSLSDCYIQCESDINCNAVDYFSHTSTCSLYEIPCSGPALSANGSSSHMLMTLPATTCSDDDAYLLGSQEDYSFTLCSCRDFCSGKLATYGDYYLNSSGTFCRCFSSCLETQYVDSNVEVGFLNVTTFYVGLVESFSQSGGRRATCEADGVQILSDFWEPLIEFSVEKSNDTEYNATLGTYFNALTRHESKTSGYGGGLGITKIEGSHSFSGWFRKKPPKSTRKSNNIWRLTHLDDVAITWRICEMKWYSDDDCNHEINVTGSVTILPAHSHDLLRITRPGNFLNATHAMDGDDTTCAGASCGEYTSGLGCSARVASYVVEFESEINPRCVNILQADWPKEMSPSISVEKLSTAGTWEVSWQCYYNVPGKYQECSAGTGLALVETTTDFEGARDICSRWGGDLVSIHSGGVNRVVLKMLKSNNQLLGAWIGLSRTDSDVINATFDRTSSRFHWTDETEAGWFTPTVTLTATTAMPPPHSTIFGYQNWECTGDHPVTGTGGCAYMYAKHTSCAAQGEWAPLNCKLSQPAFVCNYTSKQAPDSNGTVSLTFTDEITHVDPLPEVIYDCQNGLGEDQVSLTVLKNNNSWLIYTVGPTAVSAWPYAPQDQTSNATVLFNGFPADGGFHHFGVVHRDSGAVTISYDLEPIGLAPFGPSSNIEMPREWEISLWLSADNYNSSNTSVITWNDKSVRNNEAQIDSYGQPLFVNAVTPEGKWPAMLFGQNHSSSPMRVEASLHQTWSGDTTAGVVVFAIVKPLPPSSESESVTPYLIDAASSFGIIVSLDRVTCFAGKPDGGASLTSFSSWNPPGDNGWVLITCSISFHSSIQLRVNGHVQQQRAVNITDTHFNHIRYSQSRQSGTGPTIIAGKSTLDQSEDSTKFSGQIAEILTYQKSLSDEEIQTVETLLSTKYFGGPFVKHPKSVPRDCNLGKSKNSLYQNLEGAVRDVAIWNGQVEDRDIVKVGMKIIDPTDVKTRSGELLRSFACTGGCIGKKNTRSLITAVGFAPNMGDDGITFEGYITIDTLPSGDQAIISFGGKGCGPGVLTSWIYPAASGYGIAIGEWGGTALRSGVTFNPKTRYALRCDINTAVGPTTSLRYYNYEILTTIPTVVGPWIASTTRCQEGGNCVIVDENKSKLHITSYLRTPPLVLTSSTRIKVSSFGTAGSKQDIVGMRDVYGTGFAGIALYDIHFRKYILAKHRTTFAMNSTGEEVLEFTSWELRKITGHKVYLDMIDDHCSTVICTNGWIGFKDIEIKNANTTVIGARIAVQHTEVAKGEITLYEGPFENGDISVLGRCHNDSDSGQFHGLIEMTLGCPTHTDLIPSGGWTENANYSELDTTMTASFTESYTQKADCGAYLSGAGDEFTFPDGIGRIAPTTFGGGDLTWSFWIKLEKDTPSNSVVIDFANAPREHRAYFKFLESTGSIVYRVEEEGAYEHTKSGFADPEIGGVPAMTGAFGVPNEIIENEYMSFVGCYSNSSGPMFYESSGSYYSDIGGNLVDLIPFAVEGGYTYIALANTPSYRASTQRDGGAYFFNTLDKPTGDLTNVECSIIPCDRGKGICGCAGGSCGAWAVSSGKCPPPDTATSTCASTTQHWALWKRVFPSGPNIPVDGQWHHVGVRHKADMTTKVWGSMPQGYANLYIDQVRTHIAPVITPQLATRVDNWVGKPNYNGTFFIGKVKQFYLWNGDLSQAELLAVSKRTMVPTLPSATLVRASMQDCGVPDEGYGQCLSYVSRMRDPAMCTRPICECSYNGFRCGVSNWGQDYRKRRYWGEAWGVVPLMGGSTAGFVFNPAAHARCYITTASPEGCVCEGEVLFHSYNPSKSVRTVSCQDIFNSFDGQLTKNLPSEVLAYKGKGEAMVLCPNNDFS